MRALLPLFFLRGQIAIESRVRCLSWKRVGMHKGLIVRNEEQEAWRASRIRQGVRTRRRMGARRQSCRVGQGLWGSREQAECRERDKIFRTPESLLL